MRPKLARIGALLSFFILLITVWQFVVPILGIPTFLLPTPDQIVGALFKARAEILENASITILEVVLGFLIGSAVGIILGIGIAYSKILEWTIYPLAIYIKTIPLIAIAPLLTLWFGYGLESKIIMVTLITFFPLVVNTAVGIRSVDQALIDLLRSISASGTQTFLKVRLPSSVPYIFSALKVAVTLSVIGALVGEFVGSPAGLGRLALIAMSYLDAERMFAILGVLSVLGIGLFEAIVLLETIIAPWSHEAGQTQA